MIGNCDKCVFWESFDEDGTDVIGTCHRHPPVFRKENWALRGVYGEPPLAHSPREWAQPITVGYDWCGEWEEAKILPEQI